MPKKILVFCAKNKKSVYSVLKVPFFFASKHAINEFFGLWGGYSPSVGLRPRATFMSVCM